MKLTVGLALLFLVGCGESKQSSVQEVPVKIKLDPATAATISGKVSFRGKAPVMPVLDMSANPTCERLNKTPAHAEDVIVNKNGTLRNTFVWIQSGLPAGQWDPPAELAKLDQVGCVYQPHVLGLMVGQPLEISNSDTVNHNIHADATINAGWNVTEPPRAEKRTERFAKEELMFPVICGVHPWMKGYLSVVSHPFFAVTGDDGTFSLKGVPPGTYIVEAIHEKYGKKQIQTVVGPKESKEVDFQYKAEASNH